MENRRFCHRVASYIAGILMLIATAVVSPGIAAAQTRIISLSGNFDSGRVLDFGRVPFGASSQRVLAISNLGDSVLTISNLDYPHVPAYAQASFQGTWSGTIPPNSSHFVYITFTPIGSAFDGVTNDLDIQGYLTVESDATAGANYFFMSGVGISQPTNHLPVVNFGNVSMGATHELDWSLTNQGSVPITISNISSPENFWTGVWPPLTNNMIAAGSSANFFVLFSPTNTGAQGGFLTISSDAGEPTLVVLTPNGNITNSAQGFNQIPVTGTGTYPAGKSIGLFAPTNNPAFENSGYFESTCTAKGKFRATITLAGKRYPFSAQVSPSGAVSGTIARKNLSPLNISLQFTVYNGSFWTGTIDDGVWTAALTNYPVVHLGKRARGFRPAGNYAITIAGSTNSLIGPSAAGTGTLTIKVPNDVRISGELGDGARFSKNSSLPPNIPFYAPLYHNHGAILGWISMAPQFPTLPPGSVVTILSPISLTNVLVIPEPIERPIQTNIPPIDITPIQIKSSISNPSPPTDVTYKITGKLNWFKPAGIDPDYPDGFSFQTTVTGSVP